MVCVQKCSTMPCLKMGKKDKQKMIPVSTSAGRSSPDAILLMIVNYYKFFLDFFSIFPPIPDLDILIIIYSTHVSELDFYEFFHTKERMIYV